MIKEEEKYNGYYSIVTSKLNMPDVELREKYRGLSKIEDTFKVTKTELDIEKIYKLFRANEIIKELIVDRNLDDEFKKYITREKIRKISKY